MDADGDGRFESKIVHKKGNKDRAYVPQWIIDYYYELHPDKENPSARDRGTQPGTVPGESPVPEGEDGDDADGAEPPPEVRDRPNP
jgi:hypothetical protein